VLVALAALGILCTAIAFILFYRLIADIGSERTVTVTFLIPLFAQTWGALFLGEHITLAGAGGCALVLLAVALIFELIPGLKPKAAPLCTVGPR
jgi:drug/metabolite transporter (DMT)-like permease